MTRLILNIYRRLDRIQRALWFKIIATVIVVVACAWPFGTLLLKSYRLNAQRIVLLEALSGQNLNAGDEHAVTLKATGEVFINTRRYGGPEFLNTRFPLFDEEGNLVGVPFLIEGFLHDQRSEWAPDWLLEQPGTTWLLALAVTSWLLLIVWMQIVLPFALTIAGTAFAVWMCWLLDAERGMLAFAGMGLLTFTFVVLTRAALVLLNRPYQVLAVAHTVVKEASRRGIALLFIAVLLVVLPLVPMTLNDDSPLRFRIQTFISLSLGLTFSIAAVMTLFFSCASVAFEIRDRQIWHLMTKPVVRLNYLLGKWLGVVVVDLIILMVAGISTFTFIQYMHGLPVAPGEVGRQDALAINHEILTARLGTHPQYEPMDPQTIRTRVDQIIQNDPNLSALESVPIFKRQEIQKELLDAYSLGQRTIPPRGARVYTFTGLSDAKRLNSALTLRYRFHILADDEHKTFRAEFFFLDEQQRIIDQYRSTYVPTMTHSIPVSPSSILENGTLRVGIRNPTEPGDRNNSFIGAINWEEKDFELLYKAGNFEGNFFRAVLTSLIKLAFLSALGICCATFLSFPVACLLSFTIFVAGMLGPYLAQALEWYYPPEIEKMDWSNVGMVFRFIFEHFTRAVAQVIVFMLSSFGAYKPTQSLVEGRLIQWSTVVLGVFHLGVMWSGLSLIVGYVVLRKRQLAIYSGHG